MTLPTPSADPTLFTSAPTTFKWDWITGLLLAILALVIAATFSRLAGASFIDLDDETYIFGNPHVLEGFSAPNLTWALTTRHGGYWIPMTWISLQLDATLSGAHAIPPGQLGPLPDAMLFHVDNLVLHIAATLVLFIFLFRLTGQRWPAFIVALLWAIHPLRVESVAWITERKDVLSALFGFLAMYLYLLWRERPRWPRYLALCTATALSLMAKPAFVTIPFILLLLDYWPLNRIKSPRDALRCILEKWALFALSMVFSFGTYLAQRRIQSLPISPLDKILNGFTSYLRYLWMQVDFSALAVFYPYTPPPALLTAAAILLLLVVTALCLWQRQRRPALLMGWLWYVGTFIPMIGFVHAGQQSYADRFSYLPSIGLFIMIAFALPTSWYLQKNRLITILAITFILALVLAAFTARQTGYWKDTYTLFSRTRDVTSPNPLIHFSLARAHLRDGQYDAAIEENRRALEIDPHSVQAQLNIGQVHLTQNHPETALPYYHAAVELAPADPDVHYNYGVALYTAGRYGDARAEFQEVLHLRPGDDAAKQYLARLP